MPVSFAERGERICAKALLSQRLPTVVVSWLQTDLLHHNNLIRELSIFKSGRTAQYLDTNLLA
jgi:hypothetical protein